MRSGVCSFASDFKGQGSKGTLHRVLFLLTLEVILRLVYNAFAIAA